jgi:hypothetical protein
MLRLRRFGFRACVAARQVAASAGQGLFGVIVVLAIGCGDSDERAIRNQMSSIAKTLTVPANDGELGRIARIAALRNVLAPDIHVSTAMSARPGAAVPPELVGRDAVLALVGRWVPPPGGVTVEFVDVQVTLDDSRTTATVYCTAKASSGPDERPLVDARELTIGFAKMDGAWLVTLVRPEDTLMR